MAPPVDIGRIGLWQFQLDLVHMQFMAQPAGGSDTRQS